MQASPSFEGFSLPLRVVNRTRFTLGGKMSGHSLATSLGVLVAIVVVGAYILSIFWSYGDAEARGKPGCAVALIVALLSWPIGLLVWVVFRPEPKDSTEVRTASIRCPCGNWLRVSERMAGSRIHCPSCGREVSVPELSRLRRIVAEERGGWSVEE
jgi:hypothetical protein